MFQNINSGYTLKPVTQTHSMFKAKKTWTSSNSSAVHVKYVSFIVYVFLFLFAQNKVCGYSLEPPQEHSQSIFSKHG